MLVVFTAGCVRACTGATDTTTITVHPAFWPGLGLAVAALAVWLWSVTRDRDEGVVFTPDWEAWDDDDSN